MEKQRVLFVCIHNSARSQMAEALLNHLCGDQYGAESAGLEAGTLNPLAVTALSEKGIRIAGKPTRTVADVLQTRPLFQHVITVCDETSAERCPVFPGAAQRDHWSFPDPSAFTGTWDERLSQTRAVRDAIETKVRLFCAAYCLPGNNLPDQG